MAFGRRKRTYTGEELRWEVRVWVAILALWAVLLGTLMACLAVGDDIVCHQRLRPVQEPAGWHTWPVVPKLGPYSISGDAVNCVGHGLLCGRANTELRDDQLCPQGGISLDAWFEGSIYRYELDLKAQASDGTMVISSPPAADNGGLAKSQFTEEERVFIVAFQRDVGGTYHLFRHKSTASVLAILGLGLPFLVVPGLMAAYATIRAARFRNLSRFKAGVREPSGAIVFDDRAPPVAAGSPGNPLGAKAGPVLVRIAAVTEGRYREMPRTDAVEILDGDVASRPFRLDHLAYTWLRNGWRASFLVVALLLMVCAFAACLDDTFPLNLD